MDDLQPFERQVAAEVQREMRPSRPVDATAVITAVDAARSQTWRFHSMFSAAKAISAGAIVFAIAGAFLIAQPFDEPVDSVPGAEGPDAREATWVTGEVYRSNCERDVVVEQDEGWERHRTYRCPGQRWVLDDVRLSGTATAMWNADVYSLPDQGPINVKVGSYDIENEDGGWHCRYEDVLATGRAFSTDPMNDETLSCTGSGAYDRLHAILIVDWSAAPRTVEGLVFSGDVPPPPSSEER